jgi:hypothetical protein
MLHIINKQGTIHGFCFWSRKKWRIRFMIQIAIPKNYTTDMMMLHLFIKQVEFELDSYKTRKRRFTSGRH